MEKVLPWLKLKNVPGVGNLLYKRLLDQFGSPEDVFNASESELCRVPGITGRIAGAILSPVPVDADRCEIDLATAKGFGFITLADPSYPALLREIPDPPPFLYVCGNLENIQPCVAVVGSRHATDYGLAAARRLGSDLAACGITIVSGMARGIDTAAHLGALDADGSTIAVLGSGLNRIYPSENMELFQKISIKGAVISEFALNAGPDPHHFPIRNRVISGMSLGTVIVEGSMNSGSLITARLAVEQGREVFAVPGSIRSYKSAGSHYLIKQGAKLIENVDDILEEILPQLEQPAVKPVSPGRKALETESGPEKPVNDGKIRPAAPEKDEGNLSLADRKILEAIAGGKTHADDIIAQTGFPPAEVMSALIVLELNGRVEQHPGKWFTLKK